MKTHVQKWGNRLALRIPKAFAELVAQITDENRPGETDWDNGSG